MHDCILTYNTVELGIVQPILGIRMHVEALAQNAYKFIAHMRETLLALYVQYLYISEILEKL